MQQPFLTRKGSMCIQTNTIFSPELVATTTEVSRRERLHQVWDNLMTEVTSLNCSWFLILSFSPPRLWSLLISVVFCSFPAGENIRKYHRGKSKSRRTGRYLWVISLFSLGGLKVDFPVTRLVVFFFFPREMLLYWLFPPLKDHLLRLPISFAANGSPPLWC